MAILGHLLVPGVIHVKPTIIVRGYCLILFPIELMGE